MGRGRPARNSGPLPPQALDNKLEVPIGLRDYPKFCEQASGIGLTVAQIASLLRKPEEEIKEKYAKEIERGEALAALEVMSVAYEAAKTDKVALMFWLKCRQKWIDTHKVEMSGSGGGPIAINLNIIPKIKGVSGNEPDS